MITGAMIYTAREALGWSQEKLAKKANVPLGTVMRAEKSTGEPIITISQRDSLLNALRAAGAVIPQELDDAPVIEDRS